MRATHKVYRLTVNFAISLLSTLFPPRCLTAVTLLAITIGLAHLCAHTAASDLPSMQEFEPGTNKLKKINRARLAAARAAGNMHVTLVMAAGPGNNAILMREVEGRGGIITYREDSVDYIRAQVPIDQVDEIAGLSRIQTIDIDQDVRVRVFSTEPGNEAEAAKLQESSRQYLPLGRDTPDENPYVPMAYMGAPQFINQHPTFDGRGVVVAIIDLFPDILVPELQGARDLDGKPVRKIIDVINTGDPLIFESQNEYLATRVRMAEQVTASSGKFRYRENIYVAPGDGVYRIGQYFRQNAKLDVIWDEKANDVWVDTDIDFNFHEEQKMTDYRVRYDIGYLSSTNVYLGLHSGHSVFTIQTHHKEKFITINLLNQSHGTMCASAAVGKDFFGSKAGGVAPEAQLVLIYGGYQYLHGLIEAFLVAVKHPQVDVITAEIGLNNSLNDSSSTLNIIIDRLMQKYHKLVFISAGNSGPGLNTIEDPAITNGAISVGSYIHRDTWEAVYGTTTARSESVVNLSSRGPSEDGGFKPDILAPVGGVYPITSRREGASKIKLPGGVLLPAGYDLRKQGTSLAAPTAAGGAALLISAAKQSGIPYDAARLRQAILSSARYLSGYSASEQGNGLFNVGAAWEALKRLPAPVTIASRGPVNTVLSKYLKRPNEGTGVYEREGWAAGQSGTRTIIFTRSSGDPSPITYKILWKGNDGTFVSADNITLPLNTAVSLSVAMNPGTPGVHSAILELVDSQTLYPVYRMMNTIVAAERFTAEKDFTVTCKGQVEWLGYKSQFFDIPPGVAALKIEATLTEGNARLHFFDPTGMELGYVANRGDAVRGRTRYETMRTFDRAFPNPMPGVWEVIVENDNIEIDEKRFSGEGLSPQPLAAFTLTARVLAVESMQEQMMSLRSNGGQPSMNDEIEVSFSNRMASFKGSTTDTPLGSAFKDHLKLVKGSSQHIYEIEVPPGTERLCAWIDEASNDAADLDLYLFDFTDKAVSPGGSPALRRASTGDGALESIRINNPAAGKWKIVVDVVSVPSGGTNVNYYDIFTHQAFGMIKSATAPVEHRTGQSWTWKMAMEAKAVLLGDRYLAGLVELTSENIVVNLPLAQNRESSPPSPIQKRIPLGAQIIEFRRMTISAKPTKHIKAK